MANRVNRIALARRESPAGPTTLHDIPDKLLKLILLYLTSPHWLVRAAATCKRWRRIIVDANFLSEIGSIPHSSSLVAGHYHNHTAPVDGRCLSFVPSSPALDVSSRHFSLDFLPPGGSRSWEIVDSRHTLLLLAKKKTGWRRHTLPDLVVCEPLTRRYQLIPRMEEKKYHRCIGVFLDGFNDRGDTSRWGRAIDAMSSFRVICLLFNEHIGVCDNIGTANAYVFHWFIVKYPERASPEFRFHATESLHFLGCAQISIFWTMQDDPSSLLTYNFQWKDEFEILALPDHIRGSALWVLDIDNDDRLHLVCLQGDNLRIFAARRYDSPDWELQKGIQLKEATRGLKGHRDEYFRQSTKIVSTSTSSIVFFPAEEKWLFSTDFETMEVAKYKYMTLFF
ncbi:uncharacterized protein LOC125546373 [Triticum urartu]|uniref:uncharacterized protein LOC125546373 n=1 Tax=Triticum urartu TaxID=4572 RepID=UPI0020438FE0|nr:uncharacterized protein LOC125546373 [Triticum urartu]XP_048566580.1 uncharacterized protein LOC125546373 [Triticum urartu]XP_048566581.1 uncharacterized protein LOC125546373 [Triticum urartu]XP_048566583.1 uncharacterized protein LOC125546373 [Triticum urartu]XP_048566584.1 uncharacterized protein LOC125546373 [Triticum urartu]